MCPLDGNILSPGGMNPLTAPRLHLLYSQLSTRSLLDNQPQGMAIAAQEAVLIPA